VIHRNTCNQGKRITKARPGRKTPQIREERSEATKTYSRKKDTPTDTEEWSHKDSLQEERHTYTDTEEWSKLKEGCQEPLSNGWKLSCLLGQPS
jgi:hypothetical protein